MSKLFLLSLVVFFFGSTHAQSIDYPCGFFSNLIQNEKWCEAKECFETMMYSENNPKTYYFGSILYKGLYENDQLCAKNHKDTSLYLSSIYALKLICLISENVAYNYEKLLIDTNNVKIIIKENFTYNKEFEYYFEKLKTELLPYLIDDLKANSQVPLIPKRNFMYLFEWIQRQ